MRAPLASDWAMSDGLAWPSVGRKAAPTTSSTSISGHSVLRLLRRQQMHLEAEATCAVVAWRLTSVQRSALQASRRPPFRFQPVASPVSASSRS